MHPSVSQSAIDSYNDVGVAHLPGVFRQDWIDRMTRLIDQTVAGLRNGSITFGPHHIVSDVQFEDHDGYVRLVNLYWRHAEMRSLISETDCAEVVADEIGTDEMRGWVDASFFKEGNAKETATPWHNDECLYSFRGQHSPSMWVALTDIDRTNAPLQTLAGSNKDPHRYHSSWAVEGSKPPPDFHPWSELLERTSAPDADIRVWEVKAGDMLVVHPKTIHASLPRTADQPGRRAGFSLRWIGSDIRYERNPTAEPQPFEKHPDVKEGKPLPVGAVPIAWQRSTQAVVG